MFSWAIEYPEKKGAKLENIDFTLLNPIDFCVWRKVLPNKKFP